MPSENHTANLLKTIYRTLENIELWEDVLRIMCEMTGATKAIITTREKPSADIVISEVISEMSESPLLYGLSNDEIESYVTTYRDDDIWTEIENSRHPYVPYSLAQYLPLEDLKKSQLWKWLKPQGISDTIVAEIFNIDSHWIALNVYYEHSEKNVRRNIMDFLDMYLEEMQRAWLQGRKLRSADTLMSSGGVLIENYDFAAILIAPPRKVLWLNEQANEMLTKHNIGSVKNHKLSLMDKTIQKWITLHTTALFDHKGKGDAFGEDMNYSMKAAASELNIKINRMAKFDTVLGTGSPVFLLSLFPVGQPRRMTVQDMLDHPELTKTERQLVEHLSKDNTIASFANVRGSKEDAARHHWKNVKRKLGLFSHKQIAEAQNIS